MDGWVKTIHLDLDLRASPWIFVSHGEYLLEARFPEAGGQPMSQKMKITLFNTMFIETNENDEWKELLLKLGYTEEEAEDITEIEIEHTRFSYREFPEV